MVCAEYYAGICFEVKIRAQEHMISYLISFYDLNIVYNMRFLNKFLLKPLHHSYLYSGYMYHASHCTSMTC